jgi:hypothetical protein
LTSGGFAKTVQAFGDKVKAAQLDVFKRAVIEVGDRVIDHTPKKTGRARGSWQTAANAPVSGPPPTRDADAAKAELRAAVEKLTLGDVAYITTSLFYVRLLEFGSSHQAPGGMVRLTAQNWREIVAEAIASTTKGR